MIFKELELKGAFLIDLEKREDERGFFARYFCQNEFNKYELEVSWAQVNNSLSLDKGTLRGLHFQQSPHSEVKLIRCVKGAIWDVIVDVRVNSKTYGKWFAAELTADNRTMMYVPKGFAHGFISLENNSEILYMVSESYNPQFERTLRWDDEFHKIKWPIQPLVISEKDENASNWDHSNAVALT
jgi:dTDP-4-dehydrorhamnose 3,5-epimerase